MKKIVCLIMMICLLCGMFRGIPVEAASKKAKVTFDEYIYGKKHQLSVTYSGKEKLKKVEYKKGKITSTKNSKWKKATNVTKKFSSNEKVDGKWWSYSEKNFSFKKKGYITFRFTTNKNKKYVKTVYVNPKPKTISGKQTLTGKVKAVKWEHPSGSTITSYVLQLSSSKNIKVEDPFDDTKITYCNQKRVQLLVDEDSSIDLKKYVGKKVKVKGKLWGGAGTHYYIENVSFDVISIKKK